jgi:hypothetical protein
MTPEDREAAQRKLEMKKNEEEALVKTAYYNELLAIQTPKDYFPNSTNPPNPDLALGLDYKELTKLYEHIFKTIQSVWFTKSCYQS